MMKYSEVRYMMDKSAASTGEIGWNAVGALGGASAGYLLSRILHRRRSVLRDLLYALGGAGTGLAGINYALDRKPEDGGKTWREKLQLAEEVLPAIEKAKVEESADSSKSHVLSYGGAGLGAIIGAIKGYMGTGRDISGRRRANEIIHGAMTDKQSPLTTLSVPGSTERTSAATAGLGGTPTGGRGLRYNLRHPLQARENRIYDRVVNGKITKNLDKSVWQTDLNMRGSRRAEVGHVAADMLGNMALDALLGWGAGRAAEWGVSRIGADKDQIKDVARDMLNKW